MLDARLLVTFLETARSGSFARAGGVLSFTASAVSQQMATLEHRLDAVLFERSPRGVRLTPAGEALVAHATAVVTRLADAREELRAIGGGQGGRVRLGSFPTATSAFAAMAVQRFGTLYPGVEIDYADVEPYESLARLRAHELDLALVFQFDHWFIGMDYDGVVRCADGGFEYVDLFADPFHLVVRRDDPLAGRERIGLEQLAGERILGGPPWGPDLRSLCNRLGFEPHFEGSFRTTDFSAFQALVAAGLGVTLVPRLAFRSLREDVVVRPLDPAPVRYVKIALREEGYRSAATDAMLHTLLAAATEFGAPENVEPTGSLPAQEPMTP